MANKTVLSVLTFAHLTGLVFGVLAATSLAVAADRPPQEWDGLEPRKSKTLDLVYVRPGVQFKAYKSVRLDPVTVAFDKSWDPNRDARGSARLSSSDIQRIRDELAKASVRSSRNVLARTATPWSRLTATMCCACRQDSPMYTSMHRRRCLPAGRAPT
jgi:hypothetical protein